MSEDHPSAEHPSTAPYRTPVGRTLPTAHLSSAMPGSQLMIDSDGQGTTTDRQGDESAATSTYRDDRA
ncbi:hypothetical protein [Nocardia carnea]|uniref:hypothetical protein n=1 Tax=Nocardia carnea TaxID=37328 RepID=UPI0024567F3E|nr:hypothetical protein [Nocardia carnea]